MAGLPGSDISAGAVARRVGLTASHWICCPWLAFIQRQRDYRLTLSRFGIWFKTIIIALKMASLLFHSGQPLLVQFLFKHVLSQSSRTLLSPSPSHSKFLLGCLWVRTLGTAFGCMVQDMDSVLDLQDGMAQTRAFLGPSTSARSS